VISVKAKDKYHDPNIEKLHNDLLKLNLKTLAPEESSETWEVVKQLYKRERRRRLKITLIQVAAALTTTAAVAAFVYKKKTKEQSDHFIGSDI
jgi:ribosomal protein L18E